MVFLLVTMILLEAHDWWNYRSQRWFAVVFLNSHTVTLLSKHFVGVWIFVLLSTLEKLLRQWAVINVGTPSNSLVWVTLEGWEVNESCLSTSPLQCLENISEEAVERISDLENVKERQEKCWFHDIIWIKAQQLLFLTQDLHKIKPINIPKCTWEMWEGSQRYANPGRSLEN